MTATGATNLKNTTIDGTLTTTSAANLQSTLTVGSLANADQTSNALVVADKDGNVSRQEVDANTLESLTCEGEGDGAVC